MCFAIHILMQEESLIIVHMYFEFCYHLNLSIYKQSYIHTRFDLCPKMD